jgi:hypothetical protein
MTIKIIIIIIIYVITSFPHYPHGYISTKYKRKILSLEEIDGIKVIRTWVPNLPHLPIIKRDHLLC